MNARAEFPRIEQTRDIEADANRGHLRSEPLDVIRYRNGPGSRPAIPYGGPTWTLDDDKLALRMGWFLDPCAARIVAVKGDVPWDRLHFSCDESAVAFVGMLAVLGNETACRAFAYLADRKGLVGTAMRYADREREVEAHRAERANG